MYKLIEVGGKKLDLSQPRVMGILNVTPDSFYDGNSYVTETAIRNRIDQIVEEGADIIDIGAYSTRPGADFVSEAEETARLDGALDLVRRFYPDMAVSIDSFRSGVIRSMVSCYGEVIINDISGGTMDEGMFAYVMESGLPYIMMHIKGTPDTMQRNPEYRDIVSEVRDFFAERIARLEEGGFRKIILDPGFGFGKSLDHNYTLMSGMDTLLELDYPILVGISRKSMIYRFLGGTPADALNGTTVLNTFSLLKGASIVRVHDVRQAVECVKLVMKLSDCSQQ